MGKSTSLQVGNLRHRLKILKTDRVSDGGGGNEVSFSVITDGEVWGMVSPATGKETFTAQANQFQVSHKILIRRHPSLTTANVIQFGSRLFDIRLIRNLEERGFVQELLCEERKEWPAETV